MSTLVPPDFEVVPSAEAKRVRTPRRNRRNWTPIIEALTAGRTLFMTHEEVNESNLKYLMLTMSRRGKGEKLRTNKTIREGREGRLLWVDAATVVSA